MSVFYFIDNVHHALQFILIIEQDADLSDEFEQLKAEINNTIRKANKEKLEDDNKQQVKPQTNKEQNDNFIINFNVNIF
jgi:hypothetical protein